MKAIQFRKSVPRFLILKYLAPRLRRLYSTRLAPIRLIDTPLPNLPSSHWVRIAPRLAGICGSDLATVFSKGSPYLGPLVSMPFILGHEIVGDIIEVGTSVTCVKTGDRVVLRPALGCKARGIEPPCNTCASQNDALCRNVTRGDVSAGIQIGFCRDTGGGFAESLVAHESQVYKVPTELPDRAAVLIEPFACAIHAALRVKLNENDTAWVIGCGAIGLLTIAALRASGCRARIVAVAKYDHQRQLAKSLGADELLSPSGTPSTRYRQWAKSLDAEILDSDLGKPTVIGGTSATFDCVASSDSIDDGLRFTKSGGTFVLVGMPGVPTGIDWTPLWYKELTLRATYAYGHEVFAGTQHDTFDLAIEWMKQWQTKLTPLVGSPFPLEDFPTAFASALHTASTGIAKTTFAPNGPCSPACH
ncbi:MAG: alcohol dehydrogenase catalytic domain-containing protein [Planctomycetota bacterium]